MIIYTAILTISSLAILYYSIKLTRNINKIKQLSLEIEELEVRVKRANTDSMKTISLYRRGVKV